MRPPQITKRQIMVGGASLIAVIAICEITLWYGSRIALRSEAAYNAEMRQLNLDFEAGIRGRAIAPQWVICDT